MKTFNRTSLPESITHKGVEYKMNAPCSATLTTMSILPNIERAFNKGGQRAILVKVLSKNLKGKTDLHGKPYQPTLWIFTDK